MTDDLAGVLRQGGVVLVATDTVAGLAARPGTRGYADIFDLKHRPDDQALPWLVADKGALDVFACDVPPYARRLVTMFWPGALTLVLRASDEAARTGRLADDGTIALRCPDDARLRVLIDALDGPLCCTSANLHGSEPATCLDELPAQMRALPGAGMLDATVSTGHASTIVDCTGAYPRILREGPIPGQVVLDVACFGATLSIHDDDGGAS